MSIPFKKFRTCLNELRQLDDVPEFVYHATYKPALNDIRKFGLGSNKNKFKNWEDSKEGVVYLAPDPYVAESYAETSETVPEEWLEQIIVFKIETKSLDKSKLFIDENNLNEDTFEYHGVIPFKHLTLISI